MTAVLLALYNGMVSIEDNDAANIKNIVRRLRKDLPGAIESYEQYKFLYEVKLICIFVSFLRAALYFPIT